MRNSERKRLSDLPQSRSLSSGGATFKLKLQSSSRKEHAMLLCIHKEIYIGTVERFKYVCLKLMAILYCRVSFSCLISPC